MLCQHCHRPVLTKSGVILLTMCFGAHIDSYLQVSIYTRIILLVFYPKPHLCQLYIHMPIHAAQHAAPAGASPAPCRKVPVRHGVPAA